MTTTDIQGGAFDLGRVVQRTFTVISQNWLVFLISAAVLVGLPSVISGFGQNASLMNPGTGMNFVYVLVGGVLSFVGSYILQGMVVFAALQGLNGKTVDVGQAFSAGIQFFFPLLGLSILMGLGIGLGLILLIVPGVILAVMWVAAAPAVVAEKRGVMESFQRSRDLTRGNRWRIFGLIVIYWIASMVIGWGIIGVGTAATGSLATAALSPVALVLSPIVNIISAVISAAGVASIYYELRSNKEGVGAEQIASVFD